MIRDVHYSAVIDRRLSPFVLSGDFNGLFSLLDSFSHSQFRTAVYMLGEKFSLELPVDGFWELFAQLISKDSRAFLVVMLKALTKRMEQGHVVIYDKGFLSVCRKMNETDRRKTIVFLLPYLKDDEQVRHLFKCFMMQDAIEWIPFLIKVNTLPCAFVLFSSLRHIEHDRDYLIRVAYFLMKQGDGLSFNLASLMKVYFGLDELKGTFSLQLKPFELARLETSYKAFCEKMG